jgi:hypothetical protein
MSDFGVYWNEALFLPVIFFRLPPGGRYLIISSAAQASKPPKCSGCPTKTGDGTPLHQIPSLPLPKLSILLYYNITMVPPPPPEERNHMSMEIAIDAI